MIVSDKFNFGFIHIPKCAGTTIRNELKRFDDRSGYYSNTGSHIPDLGTIDLGHIPLFTLEKYFRNELNKLLNYWTFTVIRDPFSRFPSSLAQHVKMYNGIQLRDSKDSKINCLIDSVINALEQQPEGQHLLPTRYIHFQKQCDYIYLNRQQFVHNIYTLNNIDSLVVDLNRHLNRFDKTSTIGILGRENTSMVYRNHLIGSIMRKARPFRNVITPISPKFLKKYVKNNLYVTRDTRLKYLFDQDHIQKFIKEYYKDDIALWDSIVNGKQSSIPKYLFSRFLEGIVTALKMKQLAIIIPYFKHDHFHLLLSSLIGQIDERCNMYVFDDASPEPPTDFLPLFKAHNIKYLRYTENWGANDLAAHWNRCLENTKSERWIWFIPDDDEVEPGTYDELLRVIEKATDDIAAINIPVSVIDDKGRTISKRFVLPSFSLSVDQFYENVVSSRMMVTLGNSIYRRACLKDGFISFPKAWGSDHATLLNVIGSHKLLPLTYGGLRFRMSGLNISSRRDDWRQKLRARLLFLDYLDLFLREHVGARRRKHLLRLVFKKGEHYFVNEWPLNFTTFIGLGQCAIRSRQHDWIVLLLRVLLLIYGRRTVSLFRIRR